MIGWLCRHNVHLWRRGRRDATGRRTFVCRRCGVYGATR